MMGFLIVFLGGGLGAALRRGVNLASALDPKNVWTRKSCWPPSP
jgi:hypothetical protein